MRGVRWTDEERERVQQGLAEGLCYSEIALRLTGRTGRAVRYMTKVEKYDVGGGPQRKPEVLGEEHAILLLARTMRADQISKRTEVPISEVAAILERNGVEARGSTVPRAESGLTSRELLRVSKIVGEELAHGDEIHVHFVDRAKLVIVRGLLDLPLGAAKKKWKAVSEEWVLGGKLLRCLPYGMSCTAETCKAYRESRVRCFCRFCPAPVDGFNPSC